jgi:fructokinase
MTRALVVGEALMDVVDGVAHPGGSPLNVAVGLARLGLDVTLHTRVGPDPYGAAIERHVVASGAVLSAESRDAGPTSIAEAIIGAGGAATYRFAIDGALAAPSIDVAQLDLLHLGSISAVLGPGALTVERLVPAARPYATISYDPNVRPQLLGGDGARERVAQHIARADVVKASDEDLAWLHPGVPIESVIAQWLDAGPRVVAVTRGGEGSVIAAAAGLVEVPAPPTILVDTIGAGDSYMAGMLAALGDAGLLGGANRSALASLSLAELERIARFAGACAAVTVSRPGADPPVRSDLA